MAPFLNAFKCRLNKHWSRHPFSCNILTHILGGTPTFDLTEAIVTAKSLKICLDHIKRRTKQHVYAVFFYMTCRKYVQS